jgi:hypothetical protein
VVVGLDFSSLKIAPGGTLLSANKWAGVTTPLELSKLKVGNYV